MNLSKTFLRKAFIFELLEKSHRIWQKYPYTFREQVLEMQLSSFKHILNNYNCVQSSSVVQLCKKKINQSRSARLNSSVFNIMKPSPMTQSWWMEKLAESKESIFFTGHVFCTWAQWNHLPASSPDREYRQEETTQKSSQDKSLQCLSQKKQCLEPHKK